MVLAADSPVWGGMIAGVVAVIVFVLFSAWIVVQRMRHGKDGGDD